MIRNSKKTFAVKNRDDMERMMEDSIEDERNIFKKER